MRQHVVACGWRRRAACLGPSCWCVAACATAVGSMARPGCSCSLLPTGTPACRPQQIVEDPLMRHSAILVFANKQVRGALHESSALHECGWADRLKCILCTPCGCCAAALHSAPPRPLMCCSALYCCPAGPAQRAEPRRVLRGAGAAGHEGAQVARAGAGCGGSLRLRWPGHQLVAACCPLLLMWLCGLPCCCYCCCCRRCRQALEIRQTTATSFPPALPTSPAPHAVFPPPAGRHRDPRRGAVRGPGLAVVHAQSDEPRHAARPGGAQVAGRCAAPAHARAARRPARPRSSRRQQQQQPYHLTAAQSNPDLSLTPDRGIRHLIPTHLSVQFSLRRHRGSEIAAAAPQHCRAAHALPVRTHNMACAAHVTYLCSGWCERSCSGLPGSSC